MSRENVKALIDATIKTNGNQEITGAVLNEVLTAILNESGGASLDEIDERLNTIIG